MPKKVVAKNLLQTKNEVPCLWSSTFFVIYKWEDFGSFTFSPSTSPPKPSNDTPQVSSSDAACCKPSCNKFQCPEGGKWISKKTWQVCPKGSVNQGVGINLKISGLSEKVQKGSPMCKWIFYVRLRPVVIQA